MDDERQRGFMNARKCIRSKFVLWCMLPRLDVGHASSVHRNRKLFQYILHDHYRHTKHKTNVGGLIFLGHVTGFLMGP